MIIHLSAYAEESIADVVKEADGRARTLCGRLTNAARVVMPSTRTNLAQCPHCWAICKLGKRASDAIQELGLAHPHAVAASVEWAEAVHAARALLLDASDTLAEARSRVVPPRRIPA